MTDDERKALRALCETALPYACTDRDWAAFRDAANPTTVLALLDEVERAHGLVNSLCDDWHALDQLTDEACAIAKYFDEGYGTGGHVIRRRRLSDLAKRHDSVPGCVWRLRQQLAAAQAEAGMLRTKLESSLDTSERIDRALTAMTVARDEACEIAMKMAELDSTRSHRCSDDIRGMHMGNRLAELRKVGRP